MEKAPKSCGEAHRSRSVAGKLNGKLHQRDEKIIVKFLENFHSQSVLKYSICALLELF